MGFAEATRRAVFVSQKLDSFPKHVASRETIIFAGSLCSDGSYEGSFPHPLTHPQVSLVGPGGLPEAKQPNAMAF